MGAFNVINRASMAAGQPEDITQVLANFDAIAAILNGGIDNSNINVAAAILASKFAGYPADGTKVLKGDGTWGTVAATTFRSNALLDVVNSAAETDLLNQAIPGNTIGVNGIMRVKLGMDYINSSGGGINETMRVYLGATKVFDSGAIAMIFGSRLSWSMDINMVNLGVANSQNWYGTWHVVENGTGTFTAGEGTPAPAGGTSSLPWAFAGSALDTTAAQTLRVTIQHASALPTVSVRRLGWLIEVI